MWIGDYTTEPENGGLGVFSHEFGHDLGLPDLYDTAGGDNGTAFWTLMSGGSWLNHGTDSIGTTPGYMGPWEKLQLGWLDYKTVPFGQDTTVKLGQADLATKSDSVQALVVPLPERTVTTDHNTPHSGKAEWWSGFGDNLNSTLTRTRRPDGRQDLGLGQRLGPGQPRGRTTTTSTARCRPTTAPRWTAGRHARSTATFGWAQKTWDLSAYTGQNVQFRFRVATDGGVSSEAFIDDIAVTAGRRHRTVDDVESGAGAWTAKGFSIINGTTSQQVQDFYFAENRVYSGYDATLKTGPYNFGWGNTKPDWVERFPYQNGMLVWFANGEFADNNTIAHPGGGEVLPVDARPAPVMLTATAAYAARQPSPAVRRHVRPGGHRRGDLPPQRRRRPTVPVAAPAIPTFDDSDAEPLLDARPTRGLHQGGRLGHDDDRHEDHGRRQRAAGQGPVQVTSSHSA